MKKLSELVILIFLLVCTSTFSSAQIYLSGSLSGVLDDTTYIVEDSIWVRPDDSLFVLPGAVFLFEGNHTFNIYGYLSAVGTEQDSIYFRPTADTLLWGSIIFELGSSHQSALSYCQMTGASASAINCYSVNISISHCTITGNFANWGGGIYCSSANATIEECVVTDNQSVNNGGGIYCTHADPTIINCTVTGNSSNMGGGGSGRGGGGICCNHSSSPVISGCTIGGNYCLENGGGISINDNSHPNISDCDIYDNSADSSGGGIFCCSNSHPDILRCDIYEDSARFGGGIYFEYNCGAIVDSCNITNNTAVEDGGGIYCYQSDPTFINSNIEENSASWTGGGLYCQDSNPSLQQCSISSNEAYSGGGGIWCFFSCPTIEYCTINGNSVSDEGGGLYCSYSTFTIMFSTINGNSAYIGGGLTLWESHPIIHTCTISDNVAQYSGGGLYIYENSGPDLGYSTISSNVAQNNGGGLYCEYSNLYLYHCTISRNTAGNDGGGIYNTSPSSDLMIINTIIEGNTGTGGIYFNDAVNADLTYGDFHNNSGGNFAGTYIPPDLGLLVTVNANGDSCDLYYNIFLDPLFVDPGIGDFHLQGGSPCIDAGDPDSPLDPDSTTADIGAYYFDQSAGVKGPGESEQPESFRILGNYPNPFNSTTTIEFELPVASRVTLEVFDISGRRVWARGPRPYTVGLHAIQFDGAGLASGTYIYHIQTEQFSARGKMVLLK